MTALQKIPYLLLFLLLVLLVTGLVLVLVLPSHGQDAKYQLFLQHHMDSESSGDTKVYCDTMMQRRGMTTHQCKPVNTFIHNSTESIINICDTHNIPCKNPQMMNCHVGIASVTVCRWTGGAPPNCRYQATGSIRQIVIACSGNPLLPVHFDS